MKRGVITTSEFSFIRPMCQKIVEKIQEKKTDMGWYGRDTLFRLIDRLERFFFFFFAYGNPFAARSPADILLCVSR